MTLAHGAISPAELWTTWSFDPLILASIAAAVTLYARGLARLRARGRAKSVGGGQVAAFGVAVGLIAIALVSPLDALAETLVSAHMVQHLVFLVLAPPLLVYARPGFVMGLALPRDLVHRLNLLVRTPPLARAKAIVTSGLVAVALHSAAMWLWHLPGPYQAALEHDWLHGLEHVSFLATALLFWSVVIQPRARRRVAHGPAIFYCFIVWMISGGLGAILSFATGPLYPVLARNAPAWGLAPLTDQQLAGVIMWVPAGVVYLVAMAALFLRWMAALERRMRRAQASDPVAEVPR
jgi:putative membrane protein